jgi:hypothetical protein
MALEAGREELGWEAELRGVVMPKKEEPGHVGRQQWHKTVGVVRSSVGLVRTVAEEIVPTLMTTSAMSAGLLIFLPCWMPMPPAWGEQKKVMVKLEP